jgi:DnaJ-domain-containing protein 1
MSFEEIGVIVLCLVGGYWGVSFLMDRRKSESVEAPRAEDPVALSTAEPLARSLHWTAVLGISPDASIEQIDRAYQVRIAELHLDKAAALGPEARELAGRKSREIEAAYEEACRLRRARV